MIFPLIAVNLSMLGISPLELTPEVINIIRLVFSSAASAGGKVAVPTGNVSLFDLSFIPAVSVLSIARVLAVAGDAMSMKVRLAAYSDVDARTIATNLE